MSDVSQRRQRRGGSSGGGGEGSGDAFQLDPTLRGRLREAFLHELSHGERLLMVLRYAENMSVAEVAQVLQTTPAHVIATQERVVAQLQSGLKAA